ncbi:Protein cwh43 [Dispira simplex]|nr:Protein cwh43 [Dispira simplex]
MTLTHRTGATPPGVSPTTDPASYSNKEDRETTFGRSLLQIPGTWIAQLHTGFAYSAFAIAFVVACYTHYEKIVRNEFFGYPQEWLPSVSATIGDRYPARALFQILIALTAGPRFLLVLLWFTLCRSSPWGRQSWTPNLLLGIGLVRTISCGGWVYITSSDDHNTHDVAMITYMLCTLPYMAWMLRTTSYTPLAFTDVRGLRIAKKWRWITSLGFFGTIIPLVYFFIQHKVHHVPGAYSIYAIFEWTLIILDVAFDAAAVYELSLVDIIVKESASAIKKADDPLAGRTGLSALSKATGRNWSSVVATLFSASHRHFLADAYMAFVFWTLFTALGACIWYFPLWHMGISGYEAFLFITLTPFLLGIGPLRRLIRTHPGVFHFLSLVGIAAYRVEDPVQRLLMVASGTGLSTITWAATWYHSRSPSLVGRLDYDVTVWVTGLILSMVVKAMGRTNNLVWPIMNGVTGGWNGIGLLLGLLACVNILLRGGDTSYLAVDRHPVSPVSGSGPLDHDKPLGASPVRPARCDLVSAAAGLGSLIFCIHSMYTDSSTISRWVVDGYPNPGPSPVPWGFVIMLSLVLGALLGAQPFVKSWAWFGVASVSTAALYAFPTTPGFVAGCVMAVYITSVTPTLIRSASRYPPGRTMGLAMLIYCILVLAHVWVVAYAFVPGGPILRERTWVVLTLMMGLLAVGLRTARTNGTVPETTQGVGSAQRLISEFFTRKQRQSVLVTWLGLLGLGLVTMLFRLPIQTPAPYHPEHNLLTAGIWTIHFALDNNMWVSEKRMIKAIQELELDVIGLLESDLGRIIMGNRDFLQSLAEEMNMYTDYGPSPIKHTWGCAMLSKFPIKRSVHHLLPSPAGELACAIYATLDVYGKEVDVIVSHNGQEEDPLDRFLQTTELARIMRESHNPFVFLGYVVTKPHQGNYKILIDDARMHDVDPSDHDRWCQYIAYRGLKRTGYARVARGTITDTEIQMAKFVVDDKTYNNTQVDIQSAKNNRVEESHYPVGYHFPQQFRGRGLRGHFYHVFNEPRYYD